MPHLPSFLVGSIVSGTAFLIVHEQLSHRTRLSKKWKLRGKSSIVFVVAQYDVSRFFDIFYCNLEIVENKCGELLAKARSVRDEQSNTRNVSVSRHWGVGNPETDEQPPPAVRIKLFTGGILLSYHCSPRKFIYARFKEWEISRWLKLGTTELPKCKMLLAGMSKEFNDVSLMYFLQHLFFFCASMPFDVVSRIFLWHAWRWKGHWN